MGMLQFCEKTKCKYNRDGICNDWKAEENINSYCLERRTDRMKPIYTHNLAADMIELFEDELDERNVIVPDEDRNGDLCEAAIYGMTYSCLLDDIEALLVDICKKANVEYVAYEFE